MAGYEAERIADCESRAEIMDSLARRQVAVLQDWRLLADLPLNVVVEATGSPDAAAAIAELSVASGYHVAMVTKEAEGVVGPILARRARAAGVVHTLVDGDQPSLLVALVRRARRLGLPVIAAGKSTESDYVFAPATGTVSAWGRTVSAPEYGMAFDAQAGLIDALSGRVLPDLACATVPDLCEMAIVANHMEGLQPDCPGLHAPVCRTTELPSLFRPRTVGGLLERPGAIDVFVCLRRPDELSFAGGVFVVVEMPDPTTGRLLASKGIPGTPEGGHLLLHNPVHLLGVEAAASVLSAARDGVSTGGDAPEQRFDLLARASATLAAGTVLALGARHTIAGMVPAIHPAQAVHNGAPVPYYLAEGRTLARDVPAGATLSLDDLLPAPDSTLMRLRREQDVLQFGSLS
ncbi:MAG: flagellar biosynthesis protein FlgA [Deltaproteobacteria bacterium]|nr:MAG: flagellar biosynthesis protein FlgA [Deltaproteobacteria bacterium]